MYFSLILACYISPLLSLLDEQSRSKGEQTWGRRKPPHDKREGQVGSQKSKNAPRSRQKPSSSPHHHPPPQHTLPQNVTGWWGARHHSEVSRVQADASDAACAPLSPISSSSDLTKLKVPGSSSPSLCAPSFPALPVTISLSSLTCSPPTITAPSTRAPTLGLLQPSSHPAVPSPRACSLPC